MKERIDVTVPEKELDRNDEKRERLKRTFRFDSTDRVPVVFEVQQALSLAARGSSFSAYIRSPRDNLREQILNFKWRCENIPDDRPIETELLLIEPDFGAQRGVEFPVQIVWTENEAPKVQPLLHHPEDIDKLAVPEPDGGFNATRIKCYREMCLVIDDFDVRINGTPLEVQPTLDQRGGPVPAAFALCGSNLFLWLLTDPDRIHRLMDVVTRSHLQCIEFFDDMLDRTGRRHLPEVGGDTGELVSPEHFREFFAPYVKRIWDRYDQWKTYHMCGKIDHILDILLCDLEVEFLNGFGFPVDRKTLGEKWAGKIVMRGGLHPDTLLASAPGAIAAEVLGYINTVGGQGGYILSDGYGLAPGTRVENLMAVLEASRRAGCPLRASTSPSPNKTERYPFIPTV
jgi:uroporphyrinogen-III decarboxylase